MAAVMIPVFLLLTALVVDVGNWYTHKRQLQNRADAAAFAAGVEYARNWKACVQTGDAALSASTGAAIADAARAVRRRPGGLRLRGRDAAGDAPQHRDREPGEPRRRHQLERPGLHRRHRLHRRRRLAAAGQPVLPAPEPATTSPAGGHWTDVRVKERDLPSLFGALGLPLSRNGARARIEIRPAISGHQFLPLAVPNNVITKVQVRYYDECTRPTLLATRDLAPLPAATRTRSPGVGTLWGLPSARPRRRRPEPRRSRSRSRATAGCSQPYLPVGVEVRIASRDEIDFNATRARSSCAMQYADCFHRLSQIRIWNDGDPDNQVADRRRPPDRWLRQQRSPDAYFGTLPVGGDRLPLRRQRLRQLGRPRQRQPRRPRQLHRDGERRRGAAQSAPGRRRPADEPLHGPRQRSPRTPAPTTSPSRSSWDDNDTSHTYRRRPRAATAATTRAGTAAAEPVHRAFVGTQGTAGAVAVRAHVDRSPWNGSHDPARRPALRTLRPARPAATCVTLVPDDRDPSRR